MSVHREQSLIIGTFDTEQEAKAALAVKKMFDKAAKLIVYQDENGKWILARTENP